MAFQLIGAALGAVQLFSGLGAQSRQASAQREQIQAQADAVKTQQHLTKLQVDQQQRLSEANTRLEASNISAQRAIGLLQVEQERVNSEISQVQQSIQLDQRKFQSEQQATLSQAQALLNQTQELSQLEQISRQAQEAQLGVINAVGGRTLREANRGAATVGTGSDLSQLEREALQLGDITQQGTEQVGEGIGLAEAQQAYEQALSLGLLDLDRLQGDVTAESIIRSGLLDDLQLDGAEMGIESQFERNSQALQSATATELAQLELASSSADVQAAAQQRGLSAQSRTVQGPGIAGVIGALGNSALGFYDAISSSRATAPPQQVGRTPTTPSFNPGPAMGLIPQVGGVSSPWTNTYGAAMAAGSLVPGNRNTVPSQPGAGLSSLGLIPGR